VNVLTEKERSGLDDVFLSISTNKRLNFLSRLRDRALFSLKYRVKMPKIGHFTYKNHKKKKSLS
jgi:hypothetical protein